MKLAPEQTLAVRTFARRMGITQDETLRRLVTLALFAVGADHSPDAGVMAVVEAAVGKDDSATVFDFIADANAESWAPAAAVTRTERAAHVGA